MAQIAPLGVGFIDPNDRNHQVYTAEDSEFVAGTIVARLRELGAELAAVRSLADAVRAMAGLERQSPLDGQTAALIGLAGSLSRKAVQDAAAAATRSQFGVSVRDAGVVGDGVTDDTEAFHAAAGTAATFGVPLVIPDGMTIGLSSYQRLPTGLTLHANGATLKQLAPTTLRTPVIGLGPRSTVVGGLIVEAAGGDFCQGVLVADAPDVTVDRIEVRSTTPGAGRSGGGGNIATRNNGLRVINSPRFSASRVLVKNFDWSAWFEESVDVQVGHLEVDTYSLAVRVKGGCSGLRIGSGRAHGAGPNSAYLPGYNGLLMENNTTQDDIRIDNFTVEDAGEHGVRVSGFVGQSNIMFTNCITRNVGGSGFKVLGGDDTENTFRNVGVKFVNCTAIDSGSINQNCCGFLIQRASNVTLISPEVRREKKMYSAVEGIRMSGVQHVTVSDPRILDTNKYGIHIDEACGGIQDVAFSNIHISSETGHGIYLQNPGVEFRDIRFKGGLVEMWGADAGVGFYAGRYTSEDTGTWRGMNELDVTFSESTGADRQISSGCSPRALAAFAANIQGRRPADAAPSWPPFMGGSMWHDMRLKSRQVYHGDAWVGV